MEKRGSVCWNAAHQKTYWPKHFAASRRWGSTASSLSYQTRHGRQPESAMGWAAIPVIRLTHTHTELEPSPQCGAVTAGSHLRAISHKKSNEKLVKNAANRRLTVFGWYQFAVDSRRLTPGQSERERERDRDSERDGEWAVEREEIGETYIDLLWKWKFLAKCANGNCKLATAANVSKSYLVCPSKVWVYQTGICPRNGEGCVEINWIEVGEKKSN